MDGRPSSQLPSVFSLLQIKGLVMAESGQKGGQRGGLHVDPDVLVQVTVLSKQWTSAETMLRLNLKIHVGFCFEMLSI